MTRGGGADTCVEYLIKGSQTYSLYVWQASAKNQKIKSHTSSFAHDRGQIDEYCCTYCSRLLPKKCNKRPITEDEYRFSV